MTNEIQNNTQEKNIAWAFSILSDVQEILDLSSASGKFAYDKINDAKRCLMGRYIEQEDGLSIAIIRGYIQPLSQEQAK